MVGVDISKTFVRIANENAQRAGLDIAFEEGDAADDGQGGVDDPSPRRAPIDRGYALLPLLALIAAALGLAAGISHFYVGNGFSGEVGTLSAWSPLRLRVLVPIGVLCAAAAVAGAWIAVRAPRRPATPDPA